MIIGLVGRKGAGKDEAARALLSSILPGPERAGWDGVPWKRIAFADPLKEAAQTIFHLSRTQVSGTPDQKEAIDPRWDLSARTILQRLGTEVGRQIHSDVWIKSAQIKVDAILQAKRHIVITDVRFQNEAYAIRSWAGTLVRIERPASAPAPAGTWPVQNDPHPSEVEQDAIECHHTIVNNGTIADLHAAIWRVVLGARADMLDKAQTSD